MIYQNVTKKYASANLTTVNKVKQIIMLYDGAIKFMNQATEAIETNDIESRFNALDKASKVIDGLQASIDHENGQDIAKILDDYYFSVYMRIMSVHRSKDLEMCKHIINELKMMRDAWVAVETQVEDQPSEEKITLNSTKQNNEQEEESSNPVSDATLGALYS